MRIQGLGVNTSTKTFVQIFLDIILSAFITISIYLKELIICGLRPSCLIEVKGARIFSTQISNGTTTVQSEQKRKIGFYGNL